MNSPIDVFLYPSGNDRVLEAPGGVIRPFYYLSGNDYSSPTDSYLVLKADPTNSQYVLTDTVKNLRWTFDDTLTAGAYPLKEVSTLQMDSQSKSGFVFSYGTDGKLNQVTSPDGQDYNIVYTWSGNHVTQIQVQDASSNLLAQVDYKYYQDVTSVSTDLGMADDLVQVKVSRKATKDTGSTLSIVRYTQYRYSVNSIPTGGNTSNLKAVYEHDAIQRIMAANSLSTPEDLLTKADTFGTPALKNYASRSFTYYTADESTASINTPFQANENLNSTYGGSEVFEYGSSGKRTLKVKTETIGGCGSCGTAGAITKTYFYLALANSYSDQNQVTRLTIEDTADSYGNPLTRTVYGLQGLGDSQAAGGRILRRAVIVDPVGSPQYWCESWKFATSTGSTSLLYRVGEHRYPSAHTAVNSASALRNFLNPYNGSSWSNDTNTVNSSSGLIETFTYNSEGLRTDSKVKMGSSGTEYYVGAIDYGDGTNATIVTAEYDYPTQTTTRANGIATSYSYTFYDADHRQLKTKTTTLPTISSGQNGSGVATTMVEYYDTLGRLCWTQDGEGYINYYAYHPSMGSQAYQAVDVDPSSVSSEISSGSSGNWEDWTAYGADSNKPTRPTLPTVLNLVSKYNYDKLGRIVKKTDPGGSVHYKAYENLRMISFPYWDSANTKTLLPTQISQSNSSAQLTDQISVKASYTSFSTSSGDPTGFSTEPTQSDYVKWVRNTYDSATGVLQYQDRYASIPSSGYGTLSTDFYRTLIQLDGFNRKQYEIQVVSGATATDRKEQVTKYVYDNLNRVTEVQQGISGDSAANSHNMTDNYNAYPTLVTLTKNEYDSGGVGDGLVTKTQKYFGTGAYDYTGVSFMHTFRGHARGIETFFVNGTTETSVGPCFVTDVNWKGQTTSEAIYDTSPVWTSVLTGDGYSSYASSAATNRRTRVDNLIDNLGRVYETRTFEIEESTGNGSNFYSKKTHYDRNNRQVAMSENALSGKEYVFDGAGRMYQSRNVISIASTPYSSGAYQFRSPSPAPSLGSMTGGDDGVVSLSHTVLDETGSATAMHIFEATHSDFTGASVGIDLSNNDDYVRKTIYQWVDAAGRITANVNYGSGDSVSGTGNWKYATIPTRPGTAPSSSTDLSLVSSYSYDPDTGA